MVCKRDTFVVVKSCDGWRTHDLGSLRYSGKRNYKWHMVSSYLFVNFAMMGFRGIREKLIPFTYSARLNYIM